MASLYCTCPFLVFKNTVLTGFLVFRLDCGVYDLDAVLQEYGFLIDMDHNYGYLKGYSGSDPRAALKDISDPYVLQFYAVELNHAMKRALYCIVRGTRRQSLLLVFGFKARLIPSFKHIGKNNCFQLACSCNMCIFRIRLPFSLQPCLLFSSSSGEQKGLQPAGA